jgi:type VI secretion system protein VasJ
MLGSIIQLRKWHWVAVGKHPVAKDYIRFGGQSALLDAVAKWLANGYGKLHNEKNKPMMHHSWRFWLKGVKKGSLVCGVGRDSSDSIGRPYPLLIMGEGNLKGWEKQWPMLPASLDKTWSRMEYIAARHFENATVMQEMIKGLAPPGNGPSTAVNMSEAAAKAVPMMDVTLCKTQLRLDGFALISLNPTHGVDLHQVLMHVHHRLKECCPQVPRGVFIGGTPQKAYLAVAQHPLGAQDFVKLWTT